MNKNLKNKNDTSKKNILKEVFSFNKYSEITREYTIQALQMPFVTVSDLRLLVQCWLGEIPLFKQGYNDRGTRK